MRVREDSPLDKESFSCPPAIREYMVRDLAWGISCMWTCSGPHDTIHRGRVRAGARGRESLLPESQSMCVWRGRKKMVSSVQSRSADASRNNSTISKVCL